MSEKPDQPDMTGPENQRLFDEHFPMARKIAYGIAKGLPNTVQVDDLLQDGVLGLMDAIIRSNKAMTGQQFKSFAAQRIRGAVLDGLRSVDWGTRRVRREMRRVEIATQKLWHQLGRSPSEGEVAGELGLPLAEYQRLLQVAHCYTLISLDDLDDTGEDSDYLNHCASSNSDPLVVLERAAFQQALASGLDALSAQEKTVMAHYYEAGRTMRVIADLLGISEGRVSQIHAQAVARLRVVVLGGAEKTAVLAPRRKPR